MPSLLNKQPGLAKGSMFLTVVSHILNRTDAADQPEFHAQQLLPVKCVDRRLLDLAATASLHFRVLARLRLT